MLLNCCGSDVAAVMLLDGRWGDAAAVVLLWRCCSTAADMLLN
jgi:hypothetical protein